MKTVAFYLAIGTIGWLGLTIFEYSCARILAPGFGLTVPAFSAFGWVSFFSICMFGVVAILKEILS